MPKLGMEPIRREALVKATITEIARQGSLDVTVAQIARAAGMSSGLAHHYFGSKEDIFLAAMRHTLRIYAAEVRGALVMASGPRGRLEAVVRASFSRSNFRAETVAAWLNFYVLARTSAGAARLLRVYQSRLRANLRHGLREMDVAGAEAVAERLAALIDGLYLHEALTKGAPDGPAAVAHVLTALEKEIA